MLYYVLIDLVRPQSISGFSIKDVYKFEQFEPTPFVYSPLSPFGSVNPGKLPPKYAREVCKAFKDSY